MIKRRYLNKRRIFNDNNLISAGEVILVFTN